MSDSDLVQALDIKNPLHRKKLRLAIEERRNQVDGYVLHSAATSSRPKFGLTRSLRHIEKCHDIML